MKPFNSVSVFKIWGNQCNIMSLSVESCARGGIYIVHSCLYFLASHQGSLPKRYGNCSTFSVPPQHGRDVLHDDRLLVKVLDIFGMGQVRLRGIWIRQSAETSQRRCKEQLTIAVKSLEMVDLVLILVIPMVARTKLSQSQSQISPALNACSVLQ